MIRELSITNLGVIESARLELGAGLTVLTGETGAGKTLITTAVSQLLGARADAVFVRSGCDEAVIDTPVERERLDEIGAIVDEECVISRSIGARTRSRVTIGSRAASAAVLTEVVGGVVTLHGQHGQTRLTKTADQRGILDEAGGEAVRQATEAYRASWERRRVLRQRLDAALHSDASRAARLEELTALVAAVDALHPERGEDLELAQRIERLARADEIARALALALQLLVGGDDTDGVGAGALLVSARRALDPVAAQADYAPVHEQLVEISDAVQQLGHTLAHALDTLDADAEALDALQARKVALAGLVRRWGADLDAVLDAAEQARAELAELALGEGGVDALRADVDAAEADLVACATALTQARAVAAGTLSAAVTGEIRALGLAHARFDIELRALDPAAAHGADTVVFTFTANPGQEPQPLAAIGSGGELSRVMLALEVVAAAHLPAHTFIFDEVDAGIGGAAALEVGRRLAELAREHQVLVVTHLAQVAAFGNHHVVVEKQAVGGSTRTAVRAVRAGEREREIARMLGGLADSDAATSHARELLAMAAARVE